MFCIHIDSVNLNRCAYQKRYATKKTEKCVWFSIYECNVHMYISYAFQVKFILHFNEIQMLYKILFLWTLSCFLRKSIKFCFSLIKVEEVLLRNKIKFLRHNSSTTFTLKCILQLRRQTGDRYDLHIKRSFYISCGGTHETDSNHPSTVKKIQSKGYPLRSAYFEMQSKNKLNKRHFETQTFSFGTSNPCFKQ